MFKMNKSHTYGYFGYFFYFTGVTADRVMVP
jgi:hypothetical protein